MADKYRLFTKDMTPEGRAEWFREQGRISMADRPYSREMTYLSAATCRTIGIQGALGEHYRKKARQRVWYHQGSLRPNVHGIGA